MFNNLLKTLKNKKGTRSIRRRSTSRNLRPRLDQRTLLPRRRQPFASEPTIRTSTWPQTTKLASHHLLPTNSRTPSSTKRAVEHQRLHNQATTKARHLDTSRDANRVQTSRRVGEVNEPERSPTHRVHGRMPG